MKTVDGKALGRRVAEARKALDISQAELGSRVGMRQQGIGEIEAGTVRRPRLLRELARELEVSEEWLLYATGGAAPPPKQKAEEADRFSEVPLIDFVTAGRFARPASQLPVEDVPLLAFADLGRGDFFAARVKGDSMDRISPDGSIIVINRANKVLVAGKAYVVLGPDGTTYKIWQDDPPRLEPFSTNPSHKTFFLKRARDMEVIGRVRRTVLDL